jgi:hypothetical protein
MRCIEAASREAFYGQKQEGNRPFRLGRKFRMKLRWLGAVREKKI